MKLEHLIQGYKFNRINARIKETINDENERAGVIQFNDNIHASYLLDEEEMIVAISLFINCVEKNNKTIESQIKHTTDTINIIQKTIELQANVKQKEANKILKELKIFNGRIETKAVKFLNYIYKIEAVNGILIFTMLEDAE